MFTQPSFSAFRTRLRKSSERENFSNSKFSLSTHQLWRPRSLHTCKSRAKPSTPINNNAAKKQPQLAPPWDGYTGRSARRERVRKGSESAQQQHPHGRASHAPLAEGWEPRKVPNGFASLRGVQTHCPGCACGSGESAARRSLFHFHSLCCTYVLDKLFLTQVFHKKVF